MNNKQWIYIFRKLKKYFSDYDGRVPEDRAAGDLMKLYEEIMELTKKSRETSEAVTRDLEYLMTPVFCIIQALTMEQKPL